ncbi:MAG: asparagine--tRNA ligase [Deltaproteobacteria bacterium]|nr:asparagine--tRNA ligase [Deltaproteobacteria bacterium]
MVNHRIVDLLRGAVGPGSRATIEGWVRTRRDSKAGVTFVHVLDGSSMEPLQIVAARELPNYEADVLRLTSGCAVRVEGEVVASPGKGQSVELKADRIGVIGWVDDPDHYPMQPKRHSMEYLREVAHLRPRTNVIGAVTRVRHTLAQAIHRFFDQHGFYWIHTPIITASDCEGAGALFRVSTLDAVNPPRTPEGKVDFAQDFFGREAFLTVSGQLNVESYCLAMSRVYTFGPTFRAENSNTRRHLAEFWMIEPEIAFASLDDDVSLAEDFLKSIFGTLLTERADEMKFFDQWVDKGCVARIEKLVGSTFERMEYTEAVRLLKAAGRSWEFPVEWGTDLQSEHERYLTDELIGRPVAVVNYPKQIKAFYMRQNDDERTVAAMDVLAPGIGEIIGGSQREERLDVLDRRLDEAGLSKETYWWYRDLRRYGTVPHAGFGLGFERAIQYATGVENIRDVIPFPRAPRQADF